MKIKLFSLLLILFSLFGYLEWGGSNHSFLWQAEWEVIKKIFTDPLHAIHPFTIIPLVGQLLLFYILFQKQPGKNILIIGSGCLLLLMGLLFSIGIYTKNVMMIGFNAPFIITLICFVINLRIKN